MISRELLDILVCPETKQDLSPAGEALISELNGRIARGALKNRGGNRVSEKLDGGLKRADNRFLYPVRDGIPVMLVEEAIPLEE